MTPKYAKAIMDHNPEFACNEARIVQEVAAGYAKKAMFYRTVAAEKAYGSDAAAMCVAYAALSALWYKKARMFYAWED